jgi:hypothetical protein
VSAQLVGRGPEGLFEAEGSAVVICFIVVCHE